MTNGFNRPALRRTLLAAAFAASLATLGTAQADDTATSATVRVRSGASLTVEQRVSEELRAVMTELIETGAFGDQSPQRIALDVDTPAQRVSNLGVLVDSARDAHDGLRVLAVTPGGGGERMGLRAGDVLVAVNGTSLAGAGGAAASLRQTVDSLPNGGALAFDVRRDGRAQKVSGALSSVYLPAMHLTIGNGKQLASNAGATTAAALAPATAAATSSAEQGCGRISDYDIAPRQQQLHAAKIMSIDGVTPGPSGTKAYRVAAGMHTLKVAERIENSYLSFNDRERNAALASERYKTLTVDVAPDTTTLIAAHLNEDKRSEWQGGAYWNPVAWKQSAEACR
ncbi:PDZ domain-containing protein [Dokdonella soli]|uniref:PDZ domain-containing protein n=1 Tax=Dokdonella soli TaxID=529810 RepID=A0ABN1IGR8_9GAMM